jgi:polysaccharide deactylase WbmS-like protein
MDLALTSDLDWASEYCIEHFLEVAGRFSIKPTLFVTHASAAVREAAREGRVELGIHPNFSAGSTHGDDVASVLDHVLHLVPNPIAVRCHRYLDNPQIAAALASRGLKLDSNLCAHLERNLRPIVLPGGSLRFPVFFEDDVHWDRGLDWCFDKCAADFLSPGLKILNFHPFFVALNVPDSIFYARHKSRIPSLTRDQAAEFRHRGAGAGTFLVDALRAILAAGHRFVTLEELARGHRDDGVATDQRLEY